MKSNQEGRSPHWEPLRKKFLEGKKCAACGGEADLQAHHRIPFHVDSSLELVESNLVALCEHPGRDCHFRYGHFFDWIDWNPTVEIDAKKELTRIGAHRAGGNLQKKIALGH